MGKCRSQLAHRVFGSHALRICVLQTQSSSARCSAAIALCTVPRAEFARGGSKLEFTVVHFISKGLFFLFGTLKELKVGFPWECSSCIGILGFVSC